MYTEQIINIVAELKNQLILKHYTISTAESCTGGLLASYITSIPGSSAYFGLGVVSYSNESKSNILNVPKPIIEQFGAVSEETAKYMAIGVQNISYSDVAISITGIAGPDGGSKEKPVGHVCFGSVYKGDVLSYKKLFVGTRSEIRQLACIKALKIVHNLLTVNETK